MKSSQNNSEQRRVNKASPVTPTLTNNIFYNPLFLNLINLKEMGSIFTNNSYKTPWWRPLITAVGLLLMVGSSFNLSAQSCDIIVNNKEGEVPAPDGTTVDLIYIDLDLDNVINNGLAELNRTVILSRITSSSFNATTNPCNQIYFYDANGNLLDIDTDNDGVIEDTNNDGNTDNTANTSPLIFDCDDKDGGATPKSGTRFFVKIDDDAMPAETSATETNNPISSYAAIEIRSIEDNHPPQVIAPADRTIFCEYTTDPYAYYDTDEFDTNMDGSNDNFLGVVHNDSLLVAAVRATNPRVDEAAATYDGRVDDNCASFADLESTITFSDDVQHPFVKGSRVIIRTWAATDLCGNVGTATQTITVIDDENPVFLDTDGTGSITITAGTASDPNDATITSTYTYGPNVTGLTCGDPIPVFVPATSDNCDIYVDVSSSNSSTSPPANTSTSITSYYDYDVTTTYMGVDDFGRMATATRVFEYRDIIPPVYTNIHPNLPLPTFSSITTTNLDINGDNIGDGKRKDLYVSAGEVVLTPNSASCEAIATFTPAAQDACAPTSNLRYFYEAYELLSDNTTTGSFHSAGEFLNENYKVKQLKSGRCYQVIIKVKDVVGNMSCIKVKVRVRPMIPIISCGSILTVPLGADGQTTVSASQILQNIPFQPVCPHFGPELLFEIRDVNDGATFTDEATSPSHPYNEAINATVAFTCDDLGDRPVEVRVTNENGGVITCTRTVRVINGSTTSISATATTSPSSGSNNADGSITMNVGGNANGPYTYEVISGSTFPSPMSGNTPFVISGLLPGTYAVKVTSDVTCSTTTVSNIVVGVDDPIVLSAICANASSGGIINIPIRVSNFDRITSTDFTVSTTNLTIQNATPSNLPANVGFNIVSNGDKLTFQWFLQDMSTFPNGVTLVNGSTILTIQAQVTSSPATGSYTVSIDGSEIPLAATQNQGGGSAASNPISVSINNCSGTYNQNTAKVQGDLRFCSTTGTLINDATVTVTGVGSAIDADGVYDIPVATGSTVTVTPTRPGGNIKYGVSGGDLVQIRRYLLGLSNSLTGNPYKIIAADAQGDGDVDGNDLTNIQRVLLGKDPGFGTAANNYSTPSWKFIPSSQVFSNNDPFENGDPAVQSSRTFSNITNTQTADFVGVKTGDATCSAAAPFQLTSGEDNELVESKIASRSALPLNVKEQKLKAGETYDVIFTAQDFYDMLAYQTTIEFDANILTFVGLNTNDAVVDLSANNFGLTQVEAGVITTLWYTANELNLDNGTELFTLRFEAQQETPLSHVLNFTSSHLPQMAMGADFEAFDVNLTFDNAIANQNNEDKFNLNPNYPNPFDIETTISFDLTDTEEATLNIMDISGKVIKAYQGTFTQGYNEIKVSRAELPSSGILFYQLTTAAGQSAVQKMVVLD